MSGGIERPKPNGIRWWSPLFLAVAATIIAAVVVAGVGLARDEDKVNWAQMLLFGLAAGYSLIRNLLGLPPRVGREGPASWRGKIAAFAVLFIALTLKGLGSLELSMRAALLNAAICLAVILVAGAAVILYERWHGVDNE